uniref:Ntox11 domain-containing protein n=1 Tax=Rhabditophanes sp. KR3021 TaxID=114890 RepID=A0AC35UFH4_9BILA
MHNGMKNPTVPKPKFGIGLNLGNLNLKMSGNHGMGLIRGGLRGNIPAGFVIVPGMGVKISTDSAFYPVTVDKFGDAFCFDE